MNPMLAGFWSAFERARPDLATPAKQLINDRAYEGLTNLQRGVTAAIDAKKIDPASGALPRFLSEIPNRSFQAPFPDQWSGPSAQPMTLGSVSQSLARPSAFGAMTPQPMMGGAGGAQNQSGMRRMRTPQGREVMVPEAMLADAQSRGGRLL